MSSGGARKNSGAKRKGVYKDCVVCQARFYVRQSQSDRQCCSKACADKSRVGKTKPPKPDAIKYMVRICPTCGKEYTNSQTSNTYCSFKCSSDARKGVPKKDPELKKEVRRASNARHNHIKKARRIGNGVESFNAIDIYERDKWKCHLCGKKINKSLKWPDPMSASLDHVVPSSLGGPHYKSNVKAAHLRCNVKKHVRSMNEQLEMFG